MSKSSASPNWGCFEACRPLACVLRHQLLGIERPGAVGVQNLEKRLGPDMLARVKNLCQHSLAKLRVSISLSRIGVTAAVKTSQRLDWTCSEML